jgi:hypothetical protein
MSDYTRRLKHVLHENGCRFHRQGKGDHAIWFSPLNDRYFTVDGAIKSRHAANKSLRDAGLDKQF